MGTQEQVISLWRIGEESEIFAAYSEEQVRDYYIKLVGNKEADEAFGCLFEKIPETEMDAEFDFNDDGDKSRTTLRKLATGMAIVPTQVCSSYL